MIRKAGAGFPEGSCPKRKDEIMIPYSRIMI